MPIAATVAIATSGIIPTMRVEPDIRQFCQKGPLAQINPGAAPQWRRSITPLGQGFARGPSVYAGLLMVPLESIKLRNHHRAGRN
jgi:hypothetical protein